MRSDLTHEVHIKMTPDGKKTKKTIILRQWLI